MESSRIVSSTGKKVIYNLGRYIMWMLTSLNILS